MSPCPFLTTITVTLWAPPTRFPNKCSEYDTKQFDSEVPVMLELLRKKINSFVPLTGGTNKFISFYLQSLATRGERHKSQKPTLTILC